jgi:hypothetical protein
MFSAPAASVQNLIEESGLQVFSYRPGRAVVVLMVVQYVDGDLGPYNELGITVMVKPAAPAGACGQPPWSLAPCALFHRWIVDSAISLEAGQRIWGFPKIIGDFELRNSNTFCATVFADDQMVVDIEYFAGLRVPTGLTRPSKTRQSYTHDQGTPAKFCGERSQQASAHASEERG